MIPTQGKWKLPKTLSWPLGAEAVSSGLGDAPNVEKLVLWFRNSPVTFASQFQQILREARPYSVLVADYRPRILWPYRRGNDMEARGDYDAKWSIHVNPVPRAWRSTVGALLRERGLPAVVDWLRSSTAVGWENQRHRLSLMYDPTEKALSQERSDGV